MYHDAQGYLPPARIHTSIGTDHESALLFILPYVEQVNSYVRYDPSLGTSHPDNAGVVETEIEVYLCPSMVRGDEQESTGDEAVPAPASYVPNTGTTSPWLSKFHNGTIVARPMIVRFKNITDGLSNTFAFGEQDYFAGQSTQGPKWAGGYINDSFGATYGPFNPDDPPDEENDPGTIGRPGDRRG